MQKEHKIYIKGMVCQRCITIVQAQLESAGFVLKGIDLGEVTLSAAASVTGNSLIADKLSPLGFTVLEDKRRKLVKEVKSLVEKVYNGEYDFPGYFRFSELVSKKLGKDYNTISTIFSLSENITVEKYIIDYRIGKIKEFLVYSEDTLANISFRLGFNSVAHLSGQFKQQTGVNPSYFRNLKLQKINL